MHSQGMVFTGTDSVELVEIEVPKPQAGEVLVEVDCSLISPGTERAFLRSAPFYPFPVGYSAVGTIVDVGTAVKGFAVGDRVCAHSRHARHLTCSADLLNKLPDSVDFESRR